MKIQEVEKILNIPRANIRFYEKEGLISPKREKNSYREYSEEDILQLKRIVVFRKIGVSIGDIKKLMNGEIELRDALNNSEENLIAQIDELNSALELLKDMKKSETDFASVDENYYFDKITHSEKSGGRFIDLSKDYLEFEKSMLVDDFIGLKMIDKKYGTVGVLVGVIAICTVYGLVAHFIFKAKVFWYGFFYPLISFLAGIILYTPIYIISKKNPKAARSMTYVLVVILILAFIALISVPIFFVGYFIFAIIKEIYNCDYYIYT